MTIGVCVGIFFGVLALLDSGMLPAGLVVFVILGTFYGIWMARRMARYWPGAKHLSGAERVTVVRAARRGERIDDARFAQAVIDYSDGLRAAAEKARPYRRLVWLVLAVAAVLALRDTVFGSTRDAVASCLLCRVACDRVVLVAKTAGTTTVQRRTRRGIGPTMSYL